jgi:lipid-binding SYLF domain-containing protein
VPPNELRNARTHNALRVGPYFVLIPALVLILPAWGAQKSKDEETLQNAAAVLQEILSGNDVPSGLLAKANCVVILPNVKTFGFGIGGSGGRGAMSCGQGKKFAGKWSALAVYTIGGASFGAAHPPISFSW